MAKLNTIKTFLETENELSISEEDYIEMIYRLCQESLYTRVSEVATALEIKPPSVSSMLKRLSKRSLIKHYDYGTIELTDQGKCLGKYLLERHNTIEKFLKLLNYNGNFYEEAEKIEHTFSIETLTKVNLLIEYIENNPQVHQEINEYLI